MNAKEPEQLKNAKKRKRLPSPKDQISIRIAPKLRSELKAKSVGEGVSQADYIESALNAKIHGKEGTTIIEKRLKQLTARIAERDAELAEMSGKIDEMLSIIKKQAVNPK
ncbi:hypothetical protein R80B4_01879 [Fibrobacteres bacterium R8-0-B4]